MDNWKLRPRPELMKLLRRYCIALLCVEYPNGTEQTGKENLKTCGGSAFLWQTSRSKFIVTAYHVWDEFHKRISRLPHQCLIFYLDKDHAIPIFDIKLVSGDKNLDLAVLGGSGIETLQLDEKAFFRQLSQSPAKVSSGERLAVLGYPQDLRIPEKPYNTVGVAYIQGSATTSKYGIEIHMSGNPPNKFRSAAVPPLASLDIPGMSGGPAFVLRPPSIEWAGIVIRASKAPQSNIVIAPSSFIDNNGKVLPP